MHSDTKKIVATIFTIVGLVLCIAFSSQFVENVDSGEIMVVQSPISGKLTWHREAGLKWQGWGTVTKYKKLEQFWFSSKLDQGSSTDQSLKIRFNDGAHANISGSLSWEMPEAEEMLTLIHTKYGSQEAVDKQLIRTNLEKSLYMTGPMMSSSESYATRRNDLLGIIDDQLQRGIYRTNGRDERVIDPITGQQKTVKVVEPVKATADGKIERVEPSPLEALGIKIFNLSINEIKYDPTVEAQIQKQQESIMAVQSALAESKAAEQQVLTTQAQGAANAAKAEWEQKVLMATAVTEAQQKKEVALTEAAQQLEVAQLATQAAEQKKLAEILLGEGEAMRRKLVMDADGSLDRKLEAWVNVNQAYAQAIGMHQGSWVPSVVMGGPSSTTTTGNGNAAQDLVSLLTAKTAKDLAITTVIPEKSGTLPPIKRPELPTFKFTPTNLSSPQHQFVPTPAPNPTTGKVPVTAPVGAVPAKK